MAGRACLANGRTGKVGGVIDDWPKKRIRGAPDARCSPRTCVYNILIYIVIYETHLLRERSLITMLYTCGV